MLLCMVLAAGWVGVSPICMASNHDEPVANRHRDGGPRAAGARTLALAAHGNDKGREGMLRSGTAFFVSRSGEMLTSAHVVRGCRRIDVWPSDMKNVSASVVAIDDHRDVALLATNHAVDMTARPLARPVSQGTPVYTIGFGLTPSSPLVPVMTRGYVRGTAQPGGHRLLVLRAALHEGNSGGPVVDAQGALLGMIVGRYAKKPDLSVAVPARDLAQFLDSTSTALAGPIPQDAEIAPDTRLRQISALVQCHEEP